MGAGEIAITTAFSGYFVSAIFHALLGLWLQDIGNFDMSFINVTFKQYSASELFHRDMQKKINHKMPCSLGFIIDDILLRG